jgi:hypothetical protein
MSRYDHPVYGSPSAAAHHDRHGEGAEVDAAATADLGAPSALPLLLFAVLTAIGVALTTGLLP